MTRPRVVGRATWRSIWRPGTEAATLFATADGWRLVGRAEIGFAEGVTPFRYRVDCAPTWEPTAAQIDLGTASSHRRIRIRVEPGREWTVAGLRNRDLHGCTDLDLSATPATNTPALRRLALPVGARREIRTAWVLFPDLEMQAVRQRYTRLSERRYRYEGLHNGFVAEFEVDHAGLVTDYPGSWERVQGRLPPRAPATRSARR